MPRELSIVVVVEVKLNKKLVQYMMEEKSTNLWSKVEGASCDP